MGFHAGIPQGWLINVPTATSMTARELQFRFQSYLPDTIVADESFAHLIDEAHANTGGKPKVKLVRGKKEGWDSFDDLAGESAEAKGADIKKNDVLYCFFTSGTTGLPKLVGHSAMSYPLGHLSSAVVIGMRPGEVHHNLSAPGWAKWAWSSFFAPLNVGATVAGFNFTALDPKKYLSLFQSTRSPLSAHRRQPGVHSWGLISASSTLTT
jgi:4-hydroxybutyrate---CoA ligase (AMP-forming)